MSSKKFIEGAVEDGYAPSLLKDDVIHNITVVELYVGAPGQLRSKILSGSRWNNYNKKYNFIRFLWFGCKIRGPGVYAHRKIRSHRKWEFNRLRSRPDKNKLKGSGWNNKAWNKCNLGKRFKRSDRNSYWSLRN